MKIHVTSEGISDNSEDFELHMYWGEKMRFPNQSDVLTIDVLDSKPVGGMTVDRFSAQ